MKIEMGIRRCSFGFGEIFLDQSDIDILVTDEELVALGTRIDDIQSNCEENPNHYQCKCRLADLMKAVREERKALEKKSII